MRLFLRVNPPSIFFRRAYTVLSVMFGYSIMSFTETEPFGAFYTLQVQI